MYRDLIIGFDDSPPARDAMAFARRLALATGARPMALYASGREPTGYVAPGDPDVAAADADVEAKRTAAHALLAGVPDATFDAVADTSPAHAIHSAADESDAALIVLGASDEGGARRKVLGTTADAVIHAAPCAIVVVPVRYADTDHGRPFGLVVAAVDGGDETERVARVAARIARRAGGTLRIVTVADVPYTQGPEFVSTQGYESIKGVVKETVRKTLDQAIAAAAGQDVEIDGRVVDGDVDDAVARESADADLLVIGSRGYGPLRRVVLGAQTSKILRAATCPVLVVPRRTAEELEDAVEPFGAAFGAPANAAASSSTAAASAGSAAATSGDSPAPAS
jgi:nucleotide-binding universal stress UspA family protein